MNAVPSLRFPMPAVDSDESSLALSMLERTARVGIWVYDVRRDEMRWSTGTYHIKGLDPLTFRPTLQNIGELFTEESRALLTEAFDRALSDGEDIDLELELQGQQGGSGRWVHIVGECQTEQNAVQRVSGCIIDIDAHRSAQSERRRLIERMHHQQYHDLLTGLPNRLKLEGALAVRLAQAQTTGISGWLLYLDLARFQLVNQACGYAAGDRLILEILPHLRSVLHPDDLLARLGGDKFAVLVSTLSPGAVRRQAEALITAVGRYRFEYGGHTLTVGVSVGAAPLDGNANDVSTVLRQAETSCQVAKRRGSDRAILYRRDDAQFVSAEDDQYWGEQVLLALDENRFELYAQRIVTLDKNAPPAYEILLRMHQRDGTPVLPGRFLPAAQRYGLMTTLDRRVVELALEQFRAGAFDRYACQYVSINLSAPTLSDESFPGFLLPLLKQSVKRPEQLRFEITESESIASLQQARQTIGQMRALGLRVMLDDFGNGFTSFSYLRSFEVDGIKLDNSFTRALESDPFNQAVIESISGLCSRVGLELVAEGVEDEPTLAVLRRLGVAHAQGWLFHRPEPLLKALAKG